MEEISEEEFLDKYLGMTKEEREAVDREVDELHRIVGRISSVHSLIESQAYSLLATLLANSDKNIIKALTKMHRQLADKIELIHELVKIRITDTNLLTRIIHGWVADVA